MRLNTRVVDGVASPITEAYSWLAALPEMERAGVLDVAQAVPGYPPPPELTRHLSSLVDEPEVSRYGPVLGIPDLRAALADDIGAAYDADVDAERVAITAGCNQAFCLAIAAIAGPGDEVVVPVPYYFNHDMWLRMQGIVPRYLVPDAQFLPDAAEAAGLINERTSAIVLISPNNPTGATIPPHVFSAFADLAAERGIALVVDETYRQFRDTTEPPHGLFGRPDWPDVLIHLYSFSKAFSLTGYRVGGMAAAPHVLAQVDKLADCVTICPPVISQRAALYGLRHLRAWVDQNRKLMVDRLDEFRSAMEESSTTFEVVASGAYFAYVRHPFAECSSAVARRLLREAQVLALPGEMFGPGQEQYLRLAFANVADVGEIVRRMERLAG